MLSVKIEQGDQSLTEDIVHVQRQDGVLETSLGSSIHESGILHSTSTPSMTENGEHHPVLGQRSSYAAGDARHGPSSAIMSIPPGISPAVARRNARRASEGSVTPRGAARAMASASSSPRPDARMRETNIVLFQEMDQLPPGSPVTAEPYDNDNDSVCTENSTDL